MLTFRLNTPVVIRAKVKKWEQTLLFIAIHRGSRHWRSKVCQNCSSLIVCLSQQSSNQRLSVLNLSTLLGCHLDVQSLLHQQLLSSAMVQHRGLLPGLGGGSPHTCSATADFFIISLSQASWCSFGNL